ncbi:DUF2905 domain-containing protein [Halobacillus sp. ACCC02827]|uniref:DUF2905 domain-containing protein n=1 Tax=Bacillaceae TaxID=186817 RepID=UPI0002A4E03C|nr:MULTISPECIES: DUF2905 domain-containing protein [unclassified Halobacillus]ELK45727.1 hypothetical protein D479_13797 [Halobacillus sp. BAB-2008]QHT47275.1 DUF2905 domain-containing protein [Bacillus sp. SB49]WJE14508.1 DUF2905 domain-containing protein [Halobacillus sp. ACCC02827]
MTGFGKIFIVIGIVFIVIGLLWSIFGKLPGDISFRKGNMTFYFPIVTSIVVSIVLSFLFYLINKW